MRALFLLSLAVGASANSPVVSRPAAPRALTQDQLCALTKEERRAQGLPEIVEGCVASARAAVLDERRPASPELMLKAESTARALGVSAQTDGFDARWAGAEAAPSSSPALKAALDKRAAAAVPAPAPVKQESRGVLGWAKDKWNSWTAPPPPPDPLAGERRRLRVSFVGLASAADLSGARAEYEAGMKGVAEAKDAASLKAVEEGLRALKERVVAGARARYEAEGLKLFPRLTQPEPGRLRVSRDPKWSEHEWLAYVSFQLPIEAEVVLGTKFPVVSIDRGGSRALVFRGEDYGADKDAKAAEALLAERRAAADAAAKAEAEAREALAEAERGLAAARLDQKRLDAEAAALQAAAEKARLEAERAREDADDERRRADAESTAEEIRERLLHDAEGVDIEVNFAFDSAVVDARAAAQLKELGKALTMLEGRAFLIHGHTDGRGTAEYNMGLSRRRAESVRRHLSETFALDAGRMKAEGFGFSRLKNPRDPRAAENRRVQVMIDRGADQAARRRAALSEAAAEREARVAEKLSKAADAAAAAAAFAEARLAAGEAARATSAAVASLEEKRGVLALAAPAAEKARREADEAFAAYKPVAERARENATGAFHVLDYRAYQLFGTPKSLSDRFEQTLSERMRTASPKGEVAAAFFRGTNEKTGRTLAQDLGAEMERVELGKSFGRILVEGLRDVWDSPSNLIMPREVIVGGRVGRGADFAMKAAVPDKPQPKAQPKPIVVEIVTPEQLARLSPREESRASAPVRVEAPRTPDPEPEISQERAQAAERARLSRLAAEKARADAQAAAERARAARGAAQASADLIRDQLTRGRSRSVDLEVYFDFDKADITPAAQPQLDELGRALSAPEFKGREVHVIGHTDARGSAAYNLALSRRRAEAVRLYLLRAHGLEGVTLVSEGFGAQRLKNAADPHADENRRVQIVLAR